MGGAVTVSSELSKGTVFHLSIPFQKVNEDAMTLKEDEHTMVDLGDVSILAVEDNPFNQIVLKDNLELFSENLDLDVVGNGYEAIEAVQRKQYNIILMDIQLPGIDGRETAQRIQVLYEEQENKPIILGITAGISKDSDADASFRDFGFNDVIAKPVDPNDLINKITKFLKTDELH